MKRLSRGQTVEGELRAVAPPGQVPLWWGWSPVLSLRSWVPKWPWLPQLLLGGIQQTAGPLGGLGLCSQWGRGHGEAIGGGSWRPECGLLCWPVFLGNPLESLWAPRKGGAGRWPLVPSGGAEPGWPLGEGRAVSLQRDSEVARNRHPGMWCTRRSQALQTWRRVLGERAPPGQSQTRGAVTVESGRQQNPSVWHPEVLGAAWPE